MSQTAAREAAEAVARAAYGRLVAYLSSRSRDVAAAEDALSDAFHAALRTWPEAGVPQRPEAWLLTAARRRLGEARRHADVQSRARATLEILALAPEGPMEAGVPDERLGLMLACAHPVVEAAAHAPLMLQVVLGLSAADIASAFLVSPAAMSQRLVRAKAAIAASGAAFDLPGREALAERLGPVLQAIYAAYGVAWEDAAGADIRRAALTQEAIWLGRIVCELAPQEPEAKGLLALMLHCEARRPARRDAEAGFVPLDLQDASLWSRPIMIEAETLLSAAAAAGRPGRFQLEAAIQSLHAQRGLGRPEPPALAKLSLYEGLIAVAPTVGALLGRAAAADAALGPAHAMTLLEGIDGRAVEQHQPYWVLRAHVLSRLGREAEAALARERALGLTEDPAVRAFLWRARPKP